MKTDWLYAGAFIYLVGGSVVTFCLYVDMRHTDARRRYERMDEPPCRRQFR